MGLLSPTSLPDATLSRVALTVGNVYPELGCAVQHVLYACSGRWHVFSGNEIGALIGWWLVTRTKLNAQVPGKTFRALHARILATLRHLL